MQPSIENFDIIRVYPAGEKTYHGKKWGVGKYELSNGEKGYIDFPILPGSLDLIKEGTRALKGEITRGVFDFTIAVDSKIAA